MSTALSRFVFVLAFSGGLGLLSLKYQVASLEQTHAHLNKAIFQTREHIHLLYAERAHATEPQRLHRLAHQHLKTWGPIHPTHILTIDQVPWKTSPQSLLSKKSAP